MNILGTLGEEGEERERSIGGIVGEGGEETEMNVVRALEEEVEEKVKLVEDSDVLEYLVVLKKELYMEERLIRSAR